MFYQCADVFQILLVPGTAGIDADHVAYPVRFQRRTVCFSLEPFRMFFGRGLFHAMGVVVTYLPQTVFSGTGQVLIQFFAVSFFGIRCKMSFGKQMQTLLGVEPLFCNILVQNPESIVAQVTLHGTDC